MKTYAETRSTQQQDSAPSRPQPSAAHTTRDTAQLQRQSQADAQPRVNRTGMPDLLLSRLEAASGFDMSDVRVHRNSAKPAQLQAHAYAQGTNIYLGPGQERHLPHEAWHVVQQKQGRVRATRQFRGVGVNDDVGLEREADALSRRKTRQHNVVTQRKRIGWWNPAQELNRVSMVGFSQSVGMQRIIQFSSDYDTLMPKHENTEAPKYQVWNKETKEEEEKIEYTYHHIFPEGKIEKVIESIEQLMGKEYLSKIWKKAPGYREWEKESQGRLKKMIREEYEKGMMRMIKHYGKGEAQNIATEILEAVIEGDETTTRQTRQEWFVARYEEGMVRMAEYLGTQREITDDRRVDDESRYIWTKRRWNRTQEEKKYVAKSISDKVESRNTFKKFKKDIQADGDECITMAEKLWGKFRQKVNLENRRQRPYTHDTLMQLLRWIPGNIHQGVKSDYRINPKDKKDNWNKDYDDGGEDFEWSARNLGMPEAHWKAIVEHKEKIEAVTTQVIDMKRMRKNGKTKNSRGQKSKLDNLLRGYLKSAMNLSAFETILYKTVRGRWVRNDKFLDKKGNARGRGDKWSLVGSTTAPKIHNERRLDKDTQYTETVRRKRKSEMKRKRKTHP